jgi:hypothetical protein
MGLPDRLKKYREIERLRGRPVVTYVTSNRRDTSGQMGVGGQMGQDALPEILEQILILPKGTDAADLLVVSNGGDPTVAWRIMSLLRERVKTVGVLIPQSAFSAATLLALGADEIVMHPCGNLGPVDPQITAPRPGSKETIQFGSEELAEFLRFVRDDVGLTDQEHLKSAFELFCKESGAVPIGIAARASQLSSSMGEKLLRMHMKGAQGQKAKVIAESLKKKFFTHGYPVGRKEAKELGLKVIEPKEELERLIWEVWLDLEAEMKCRHPFSAMDEVAKSAVGPQLFAPIPQVTIPSGLPPDLMQQVVQQVQAVLQQNLIVNLPPVEYQLRHAIVESARRASAFVTEGKLFARREPDLRISLNSVVLSQDWRMQELPKV